MNARPPRLAEWLVRCSLAPRPDERDAVLGDLAEEHDGLARTAGVRTADRWYWRQTLASIGPNLLRAAASRRMPRERVRNGGRMESMLQDIRYALRMVRRRPGVTVLALASLVVGISVAAVVFSLLNAVLLRPLPVRDPERLALVLERRTESVNHNFSYPDFADYRASQQAFEELAAYSRAEITLGREGGARVVAAELVSGGYFATLAPRVRFGRGLSDADDRPGVPVVAVVGESLWREIAGQQPFQPRTVILNQRSVDVVGVVAAPFQGTEVGRRAQVWVPIHAYTVLEPGREALLARRTASWLTVIGRLRPGVSFERAAGDINRVDAAIGAANRRPPRTLFVAPGRQGDSMLPTTTGGPLGILLGASILVLLVACANAANLLLARARERAREMAVRSALGAGRGRLVRLAVVETLILGVAASALALAAAAWLARLAAPMIARFGEPVTLDLSLDWRMLSFVAACGLGATAIGGLALSSGARQGPPAGSLSDGGRLASDGPAAALVRRGLVVIQFALSLALVVAAALLARTIYNLRSLPTGLDLDRVVLLGVEPAAAQLDRTSTAAYLEAAVARLAAVPGVQAAGFGRVIPLGFGGSRTSIVVPGYTPRPDEDMEINFNVVSPSYFDSTGIALLAGRSFDGRDIRGSAPVAIVNETMASRYWAGRPAVGQSIRFGPSEPEVTIIGVAPDVKYRTLRESPGPSFYLPLAQEGARGGTLHVRTHGEPRPLIPALHKAVADINPAVPVTTVRTLREQAALNVNDERVAMLIGLSLGAVALLLAASGLYGTIAYAVGQRTRELGVRIALGATGSHVRRLILADSLLLVSAGSALGIGVALVLARAIESRLFGVRSADAATLAASIGLLTGVALVASWLPARRASRIDPVNALRVE